MLRVKHGIDWPPQPSLLAAMLHVKQRLTHPETWPAHTSRTTWGQGPDFTSRASGVQIELTMSGQVDQHLVT
jgi:hypothetical protein